MSGNVFAYTDTCLRQGRTDFEERREKKVSILWYPAANSDADSEFYRLFWNAAVHQFVETLQYRNGAGSADPGDPVDDRDLFWLLSGLDCKLSDCRKQREEFVWRFFAADVLARLVCMAFYLLLPTTNVRPSIPEQGFWNQMLALLYQMDAADNLFPSIHCLNSWFCYIAVRGRREIPRWYQRFSFWAALAVFVSTLTTKQHVIADVIGGALLAEVTWQIAGRTHLGAWYGMILERRRWKRRAE